MAILPAIGKGIKTGYRATGKGIKTGYRAVGKVVASKPVIAVFAVGTGLAVSEAIGFTDYLDQDITPTATSTPAPTPQAREYRNALRIDGIEDLGDIKGERQVLIYASDIPDGRHPHEAPAQTQKITRTMWFDGEDTEDNPIAKKFKGVKKLAQFAYDTDSQVTRTYRVSAEYLAEVLGGKIGTVVVTKDTVAQELRKAMSDTTSGTPGKDYRLHILDSSVGVTDPSLPISRVPSIIEDLEKGQFVITELGEVDYPE